MRRPMILAAAALLALPAPLAAHEMSAATAVAAAGAANDGDDEGNPRLGLLGLLGLAGLLGLFRKEPDIHVDARRGRKD